MTPAAAMGRPSPRAGPVWVVAAVGLLAIGAVVWLGIERDVYGGGVTGAAGMLAWAFALAAFVVGGAVVGLRQPGNLIGWLLMLPGISASTSELGLYWLAALDPPPQQANFGLWLVLWFLHWSWILLIFPIFGILLTLPSGRLLSSRWRWVAVLIGLMSLVMLVLSALARELELLVGDEQLWAMPNPIGIIEGTEQFYEVFSLVWNPLLLAVTVASVAAFVLRYRRGTSIEQHQLKWPLWAVLLFGMAYGALAINSGWAEGGVGDAVFALSTGAVPISIAIAVLKYRLFEIDRIVSRTVSYTVVVGLSAAMFFGGVTALSSLLPAESDLAVAGSTLAVAALFNPLRRRVQSWVDRRFNRSRYSTARVMDGFAGSLRDRVDPDRVIDDWVGVVTETMQPSTIAVWAPDTAAARVSDS